MGHFRRYDAYCSRADATDGRPVIRAHHATRFAGGSSNTLASSDLERYVAAFNRRDWDAVRSLLSDEARLEVVHRSEGPFGNTYFTNYGRLAWPWKLALAHLDGIESVVHFRHIVGAWLPHAIIQLAIDDDKIAVVRDYVHIDYLLRNSIVE